MAPSPSEVALQAALDGNLRLLKKMAKKVDLRTAKDLKGDNALHFAAVKGSLESCKFLVEESGLDVNCLSLTGATPMYYAALEGKVEVMRYLLGQGGDPAMANERGSTPLHNAAGNGHCEAVRLLLAKGVHVDTFNHRVKGTPLHLAAAKDYDQVVKILLEHGADLNRVVHQVVSPLMMALAGHSVKCMKLLIEHGKIPIELAADYGRREMVEILFPRTKPIPSLPDWSIDGIISTVKSPHTKPHDGVSVKKRIADLKSQGKEAFANEDYLAAMYFYGMVMEIDPLDATMFSNRSLCWLRIQEEHALIDARQFKIMQPCWSKAWYREGAALRFMKV